MLLALGAYFRIAAWRAADSFTKDDYIDGLAFIGSVIFLDFSYEAFF